MVAQNILDWFDINKIEEKYKQANKKALEARQEWEEKHPIISGIQKDYQPGYRAAVPRWEQAAEYGLNAPLKEQAKTGLKEFGLNLVPSVNIAVDAATGGSGTLTKQAVKQAIAKPLVPYVGKQIAKNTAEGLIKGAEAAAIGGATQGVTSSIADNGISKDLLSRPILYGGMGLLTGGAFGGLGGFGAGQIGKQLARKNLLGNPETQMNFARDYLEGLNDKVLTKQGFTLGDIRGLKTGEYGKLGSGRDVLNDSANPLHRYQADLINKYNPAPDSYHTWVRNADDIYKFEDTLKPPQFDTDFIGNDFDPSYTWDMAQDAIKNGEMEVFSSYPIEKGVFVTPSPMEAQAYAGSNKIYSKKVPLDDVAWIDAQQGQYAPIDKEYMEGVFNDAKNDIKRLSKQDYRNLGKKYYSNEFMPDGVYKENYGQIDFNNHNRGKDELQVLQDYPELKGNIQDAEYGFTSNHNNELDREYDHLIKADNKDVYDYVIERLDNGKNIYKMTDRLNKKKK